MWAHGLRQSTVDNIQGMDVAGGCIWQLKCPRITSVFEGRVSTTFDS